jgi:acetylornithine aminotransferase
MPEPSSHLIPVFNRQPLSFQSGQGVWLTSAQGTRYLDALSGIAVCGMGHAHPKICHTLNEQVNRLWHTSNLYSIEWQHLASEKLCEFSGMDQVFLLTQAPKPTRQHSSSLAAARMIKAKLAPK